MAGAFLVLVVFFNLCTSGEAKKIMKDRGGEDELVMFLSGMGGTGKSEVIKAFIYFAQGISIAFGWNYDNNVIKVTALTGSAACEIPNGKTLHSQAGLTSRKIPLKLKEKDPTKATPACDLVNYTVKPGSLMLFPAYMSHAYAVDHGIEPFR